MKVPAFIRTPYTGFLAFSLFLMVLPLGITNNYHLNVLIFIGIHSIIAIGLDLLIGYTGQISLGHAAFFGLGAYISGILSAKLAVNPALGLVVSLTGVGIIAYIIGVPTLKLHGHYLAMATLGFGIIVFIFFNELVPLTGGPSGLTGIEKMSLFGYSFDSNLKYYFLVSTVFMLVLLLSINIVRSRVGRVLRAIHGSEVASSVLGVDVARYKVAIFVLSAVYAAAAGWLYAHYVTFVSPSSFGFLFSIKLVTMVVIGSLGSIWGGVFGAALLTSLPEFLHVFENYETTVFGLILITVMIFMPKGLLKGLEQLAINIFKPSDDRETVKVP
jgi:branched-chain amino acid transport system permease protein